MPEEITAENRMRILPPPFLRAELKSYLSVLENVRATVRNCEKENFITKCQSGNFSSIILGSFLAEFNSRMASKNRLTADEGVDYEGKLKRIGTLSEGEKA
ncbi:MAG: hypothetical protein ACM37Z_02270 [Deltaproteobacteria bacterium]